VQLLSACEVLKKKKEGEMQGRGWRRECGGSFDVEYP